MEDKLTSLNIKALVDVMKIAEGAICNGYEVTITPVYDAYWEQKLEHYKISFNKIK